MSKPQVEVSLHPSGWLKVQNKEFLGKMWPEYANACLKAGATAKCEKNEKFYLIVPNKMDILRGELEGNFQLSFRPDAEAHWRKEEDDRQILYDQIEEGIRLNNEWLAKLDPPSSFYPYQRHTTHWLATRRGGLVGLPEGAGKTPIFLLAIRKGSLVVIVCPAGVMYKWKKEVIRWRKCIDGEFLRVTVHKSKDNALNLGVNRSSKYTEFHICSYKTMPELSRLQSPLFWNRMPRCTAIIDEAHYARNVDMAVRAKQTLALCETVLGKGGNVYLGTGSPVDKYAQEIWNILSLAGLQYEAYDNYHNFKTLNNCKEGPYGIEWGSPTPEVHERLLKVAVIKRKEEIMPFLPPVLPDIILPVDVQLKASKKFDAFWELLQKELKRGLPLAEILHRIRQKRLGIPFEDYSHILGELARQKIPYMKEEVLQYLAMEEPLVVASDRIEPLEALAAMHEGEGPWGTGFPIITGDVKPQERQRIIESFQAGDVPVVGISKKAAGEGVDLYRACHMLHLGSHWSYTVERQVRARIHRIGQVYPCQHKYLLANHPLDTHMHDVNMQKQDVALAIMYGEYDRRRKVTREEWEVLVSKIREGRADEAERALAKAVYRQLQRTGGVSKKS